MRTHGTSPKHRYKTNGRLPATTATYTFNPTADTYVDISAPTDNFGDSNFLNTSDSQNVLSAQNSLLLFDVSSLNGKTIVSAQLEAGEESGNAPTVTLRRCTRTNWVKAEVTWNIYKTGSNWTQAGGDFSTPTVDYTLPGNNTFIATGLAALVQDAIDNRSGLLSIAITTTSPDPCQLDSTVGGPAPVLRIVA